MQVWTRDTCAGQRLHGLSRLDLPQLAAFANSTCRIVPLPFVPMEGARRQAVADRTVMVVEDDASIRDVVMEILAFEGFDPISARNGEEALVRLRRDGVAPALILLDLMMPVMNGWQFRSEQLRDPRIAKIPVVVMSASEPEGLVADARVTKPFDIAALLAVIARVTSLRSIHRGGGDAAASATCRSATEFMQ